MHIIHLIERYTESRLNQLIDMYALGHAINGKQLFLPFDNKRIKTARKHVKELVKSEHKEYLANMIFADALQMIVDDMIDNSITFDFKLAKGKVAELYIKEFSDEEFLKRRKRGLWKEIDYLATNFSGYQPMFKYQKAGYTVEKPIHLDTKRKLKIAENANNGKSYY